MWLGMIKENIQKIFINDDDANEGQPLQEVRNDSITYTDGNILDVTNTKALLGATILRGPCFALAANENLELRDWQCHRELGFVCLWKGEDVGNRLNNKIFYFYYSVYIRDYALNLLYMSLFIT